MDRCSGTASEKCGGATNFLTCRQNGERPKGSATAVPGTVLSWGPLYVTSVGMAHWNRGPELIHVYTASGWLGTTEDVVTEYAPGINAFAFMTSIIRVLL